MRLHRNVNLRLQHAQGLEYEKYERYLSYDYHYYTDGSMTSLTADFHPFDNGFFLSTGYVLNRFKIKGDSEIPQGSRQSLGSLNVLGIPLISATATATDDITLDAKIRWREHGPRLSTGWLFDVDRHFLIRFEIGALFFGDPTLILVTDGEVDGTDINQIDVVNEERSEQIDSFDKKAGKYDVLPIFNFGMNYRF
ncbi:hypothetical protein THMIRHAS_01510 [Thiosulfatimonas sediminis]|uniref:Uncharacterized protein n=1 Tax=Thiosulfatimonas sediminis TaxID=2675054 RepID=A0A6F8PRY0_9GAMM|nr:hypothetical protein [Thiosulfatimonas sediminis]BBP44778.1 hypothetical protein THMIRHAS_01510 [Thiosulfatimonas sediminis]